jgi:hypothetical protein
VVPLRQENLNLHDHDAVTIRFHEGDSDSADRYTVALKATYGASDLDLMSSTDYFESRQAADSIAKFLRFPMVDASTDHESVTDPDRLEETFQERLRSSEDRNEGVSKPLVMRSQVHEQNRTVQIKIPGPGFKPSGILGLIIPAGILAYAVPHLLRFFGETNTPPFVQVIFVGFLVLFFGVIPLCRFIHSVLLALNSRTLITISADGIDMEERGAWRTKKSSIPASEILDLDYDTAQGALSAAKENALRSHLKGRTPEELESSVPQWLGSLKKLVKSKGVVVKSKKGFIYFGAGLPDEEVRYLYWVAKRTLGAEEGYQRR